MAVKGTGLLRGERLQIMLSPEELAAVDDFRFKHRMPSRAAAVRELFRLGLSHAGFAPAEAGRRSAAFGVFDAATHQGDCRSGDGRAVRANKSPG